MADVADVENALLGALQSALLPNGPAAPSVSGAALHLYRGWPIEAALAGDMASGIVNVSVFSVPHSSRNTTRWGVQVNRPAPKPGTTVSVAGAVVTLGGAPAAGDLVGLLIGGQPFVHVVAAADTPITIAAALADLTSASYPCLQAGNVLTFPTAPWLIGRVTAPVDVLSEWARQEQTFRLSTWAPAPQLRDTIGGTIAAALAPTAFLTLADGTAARLRGRGVLVMDDERDSSVYRRDDLYDVEYATTTTIEFATMLFGELNWNMVPYYG